jgi:YfiH family protein
MMFMLPQTNDGFAWVQAPAGSALVCRALEPFASHLFTTRDWTLGSPSHGDESEAWDQVAGAADVDAARLVRARQVHGADVIVRRAGQRPHATDATSAARERPAADILISNDATLALAIQTADCVPILLADRRTGAVAAAHAGWRGLAAGVPAAAVDALAREFGCRAEDLIAAAGPSISAPRYEVGPEVRDAFQAGRSAAELARWFSPSPRAGHWQFDGWAAVRDQLEAAGVPSNQIHVAALCTATYPDLFCSYRRDGSPAGRMAAVVRSRLTTPQPRR